MQIDKPKRGDIVLIDANVIIEADKLQTWKAISSAYELHTVETVIKEALKVPKHGRGISISEEALRNSFSTIYAVSDEENGRWILSFPELIDSAIDDGERDLLTYLHCCQDKNIWFLCGPDVGAMKGLYKMGRLEHLVSLEQLQKGCGISNKIKNHFNQKWHDATVYEIKANLR
ncbi:MAG: hypothetical protein CBB67_004215 [Alteromonadaceae bacterium TMED7]|nr:hypothetical protein EP12_19900 [Alteromonas australica]RPH21197.1 MAG: hypothetical protein CBB67_004215 [Alteromonadaceae bacterium TMED7]HCV05829.1 hypothetical protein [Pseudoalteromonas sp.]|tara:strand:- start:2262 stop:2783 length:522 start_codon:yes stop_codon:yes gene_type:complete